MTIKFQNEFLEEANIQTTSMLKIKRHTLGCTLILLLEVEHDTITFENCLADFYKVKHTLKIQSSNFTPNYLFKRNENICPKNTCTIMF